MDNWQISNLITKLQTQATPEQRTRVRAALEALDAGTNGTEYVERLESTNVLLRAALDDKLKAQYDPNAQGLMLHYSQEQVEQIVQQTRNRQYEDDQLLGRAMVVLGGNLAALQAAAGCNNGDDTKRVLQKVNADMLSSIDMLDNALTDLSKDKNNEIDWPGFNSIIQGARELRNAVKRFDGSFEAKKHLEAYIAQANPKIATMIQGTAKKPGATVKDEDWLTVEAERLVADGYTQEQTAARLQTRLQEQQQKRPLTQSEQKALNLLQTSKNPAELLGRRLRRKNEKKTDKLVLSAQDSGNADNGV